jgi:hypothetical protein
MTHLDPDLERLGDALRASIAIDLTRDEQAVRSTSDGRRRHGAGARTGCSCLHPRALAGGTLGFAGIGVTLVLALSAGGATAPSAFAVTKHSDGSVLVQLDRQEDLGQAHRYGDPRADHSLPEARASSRQWPGELYTRAGRGTAESARAGCRRHGRLELGPERRQHRRGHLLPDLHRRAPHLHGPLPGHRRQRRRWLIQ